MCAAATSTTVDSLDHVIPGAESPDRITPAESLADEIPAAVERAEDGSSNVTHVVRHTDELMPNNDSMPTFRFSAAHDSEYVVMSTDGVVDRTSNGRLDVQLSFTSSTRHVVTASASCLAPTDTDDVTDASRQALVEDCAQVPTDLPPPVPVMIREHLVTSPQITSDGGFRMSYSSGEDAPSDACVVSTSFSVTGRLRRVTRMSVIGKAMAVGRCGVVNGEFDSRAHRNARVCCVPEQNSLSLIVLVLSDSWQRPFYLASMLGEVNDWVQCISCSELTHSSMRGGVVFERVVCTTDCGTATQTWSRILCALQRRLSNDKPSHGGLQSRVQNSTQKHDIPGGVFTCMEMLCLSQNGHLTFIHKSPI